MNMEFAVCPACHQSVLDDDAANCPFCGASMSAKPGAKPAGGKPVAPPAAKPAAKAPAKPAAKGPADDLPFGVSDSVTSAVSASRQPAKGRTYKVVCPMCETEGYVPSSAAGKDVKCANTNCMVPVFTAPLPEPVAPPPPPKKKSGNLLVLGIGTAVVVGGVGAGIWFVASQPASDGLVVRPVDITNIPKTPDPTTNPANTTPALGNTPADNGTAPSVATAAVDNSGQILTEAMQESQQASLLTGSRNRSKPYCRRYTAEIFALAGDLAGARQQIDALANVGTQLPFYQVTPWVEVFWQEQAASNGSGATAALNSAQSSAEKLPNRGRDQLDSATRLAVALLAEQRIADARTLIAAHQTTDLDGEVSACFQWLAVDRMLLDPRWLFAKRPIVSRSYPQAAAVAACAVLRGNRETAQEYANSWPDAAVKAECLAAWGEAVTWRTPGEAVAQITPVVGSLPPAQQALIWSRAARVALAKSDQAVAQQLLDAANQSLTATAPPANYVVPDLRSLVKSRPQMDANWAGFAAAAAELAAAQLEAGTPDAAKTTLDAALQYTRGLGPAQPVISELIATADRLGPAGLRNYLKTELELRTDDEARLAMGEYRRSLGDLESGANNRFRLQTTILVRAVQLGLEDHVWTLAAKAQSEADPALRELHLGSEVAAWLSERFRIQSNTNTEKMLVAARETAGLPALKRPTVAIFEEQLAAGKFPAAWVAVNATGVRSDLREYLVLRTATEAALSGKPMAEVWSVVTPISDVVLREQALEWASWMAARRGQSNAVWQHRKNLNSATEIVSLARGVVAGIQDWRSAQTPVTTEAATEPVKK